MLNNKKGFSMILVISTVLMLLVLAAAAAMISTGHFGISQSQRRRIEAYYAAEAAMQHVLWALRANRPNPHILPGNFNVNGFRQANFTIPPIPGPNVGVAPEGVRPIRITVHY